MFSWYKAKRGPADFWSWLVANAPRIQAAGRDALVDTAQVISLAFKKSFPDLVWEITPSESSPWLFCISAGGNLELFDQVETAVAAAPHIPGWEIKAFRQRGSLDAVIEMHGRKLGYDDVWCEVEPDEMQARVTLLIRGLTTESADEVLGAALILLDNALGEYDSVARISELNNGRLPDRPVQSKTFFPLSELPAYMDNLRKVAKR